LPHLAFEADGGRQRQRQAELGRLELPLAVGHADGRELVTYHKHRR